MPEYIPPINLGLEPITPVEVKDNGQRTPKRITIQYQTTAIFQDISKKNEDQHEKDFAG